MNQSCTRIDLNILQEAEYFPSGMDDKCQWFSSFLEVFMDPSRYEEIETFYSKIKRMVTTKEMLLRILKEGDWDNPDEAIKERLISLCSFINEVRSGKPKSIMGVRIATDPCIVELLSDWILPADVAGISALLSTVSSDDLYDYFMTRSLTWCTEEDYDQQELEKRFSRLHQNLMAYGKEMEASQLREWADDLPSLEREDMLGSDPHPLFSRAHAIASYFSLPSWVEISETQGEELPDLAPVPTPSEAMSAIDQTLLNIPNAHGENYSKALARLKYTYQLTPYSGKMRFIRENNSESDVAQDQSTKDSQDEMNDEDDIEYFHRYGPVNTGDSSDPECLKYGGCRMLLCCCQVTGLDGWDDEDDMVYSDQVWEDKHWFKHSCEVCGSPIRRKEYAVRLASQDGGWYGCYCSYNCRDSVGCSEMEQEMNEIVKQQLETNKIYVPESDTSH
jgi:hypothetical protein